MLPNVKWKYHIEHFFSCCREVVAENYSKLLSEVFGGWIKYYISIYRYQPQSCWSQNILGYSACKNLNEFNERYTKNYVVIA